MLEVALALARFSAFLGAAIASGFVLFGPQGFRPVVVGGAILLLAGALGLLPLEAVALSGEARAAFDPATLLMVLLKTPMGASILARSFLGGAVVVILLVCRGGEVPKAAVSPPLLALAAGALGGHAAAGEGVYGLSRLVAGALHALAAGLWAGALLAFVAGLAVRDRQVQWRLRRFSGLGAALVVTVIITGTFAVFAITGDLSLAVLTRSAWGRLLLLKMAMVCVMVALAMVNRSLLSRPGQKTGRLLDASVRLEAALGVLVLALVSFLGLLSPL